MGFVGSVVLLRRRLGFRLRLLSRCLLLLDAREPAVGRRGPQHVLDGDDVVVGAQGAEQGDLAEGAPGVGGVVEGAGDLEEGEEERRGGVREGRGW